MRRSDLFSYIAMLLGTILMVTGAWGLHSSGMKASPVSGQHIAYLGDMIIGGFIMTINCIGVYLDR